MNRVQWALAVGFFVGLGVQLALAQPVPLDKFRNLTVTNSLAVGNDLTVGDDLTVTDLLRAGTIDAGTLNVANQLGTSTLIVNAGSSNGIAFTDANGLNRITYGSGRYVAFNAGGYFMPTGGADGYSASSFALGTTPKLTDSATEPTVANGCTGEAMVRNNGSANFEFDVGTLCTGISTMVITLPAVANCWNCQCWNITQRTNLMQSACGTTSATITNMGTSVATPADWTDGDNVQCACRGG